MSPPVVHLDHFLPWTVNKLRKRKYVHYNFLKLLTLCAYFNKWEFVTIVVFNCRFFKLVLPPSSINRDHKMEVFWISFLAFWISLFAEVITAATEDPWNVLSAPFCFCDLFGISIDNLWRYWHQIREKYLIYQLHLSKFTCPLCDVLSILHRR